MDREAWQATVHRVAKSWTQLKRLSMHTCMYTCKTVQSCMPKHLWGRHWHVEICGSINIPSCFFPLHLFMNSELFGSRENCLEESN